MKNPCPIKHFVTLALSVTAFASLVVWLSYSRNHSLRSSLAGNVIFSTSARQPGPDGMATGSSALSPPAPQPDQSTKAWVNESFGQLPLYFVENRGQLDPRVAYYVQGRDKTLYFTAQGITFSLTGRQDRKAAPEVSVQKASLRPAASGIESNQEGGQQRWVVKLDFVGANPGVKPVGQDQTEAVISYFKGTRDQWQAGLRTYATIVYPDLWPGIDLVYSGTVNRLKYQFVVKPGADPNRIKLAYRGVKTVKLNEAGQLEVSTPAGGFQDDQPYSYQEVEGQRVEVATAYALKTVAIAGGQAYGFRVSDYDKSKPLVLDPVVLVYCGYIGGAHSDSGSGIAVDSAGNAYVTGTTYSTEATFPVTVGPDLTFNGSGQFPPGDVFVAKVNASGTGLVYCGYIGGNSEDRGIGIAVDSAGNAYVTGSTTSTEATFPVTVGPDLTYNGGGSIPPTFGDAFVAKVNANGTGLVYCGYIGGSGIDYGSSIAVDSAGGAYVTGSAESREDTFPVTVGPDLTFNSPSACTVCGADAFVAKVNANGTGLVYCGYIGGFWNDSGQGIAVDNAGNAYVAGSTGSAQSDGFPVTVGPDLTFNSPPPLCSAGGCTDAFVAKVNAAGMSFVYCGYIGGASNDVGKGIAIDSGGNVYITGSTQSTEATFPVTVGPDLTFNSNPSFHPDAFVAKVNANGASLIYCGYIGGAALDSGNGIAVDSAGNAYVTGTTESTEATFPVTVGPDLTFNGSGQFPPSDAFVAKVNASGTSLIYCGYIGGSSRDESNGIAVDSAGNAYITGVTQSTEATFPVTVGPDLTFNSSDQFTDDAFVAKIGDCSFSISPTSQTFGASSGSSTVVVTTANGCSWTAVSNDSFITVTSGASGAGNGTVNYSVAANASANPRTGTMTIAGQTFTVIQNGVTCAGTISPTSASYSAVGGTGSVTVPAPGGCSWTAASNDSWITITSGGGGTGNGTVNYSVAANPGTPRTGTMFIAGQIFTVTQSSGLQYYPLAFPVRVLDTRPDPFPSCVPSSTPLVGGGTLTLPVVGDCNGLTIPASAKAVVGNATVVNFQSGGGFITLFPSDATLPNASNLNFTANHIVPNSFTVGLGSDGAIKIFTSASTNFIVDITGYYAPPGAGGLYFHPLAFPVRMLDTRPDPFPSCVPSSTPLTGGGTLTLPVVGDCNTLTIPASAKAIVGNATVVNFQSGGGFITLFPSDAALPNASNLNFTAAHIVPNSFVVGLGLDGAFKIFTSAATNFIVDITGYFSDQAVDVNGQGLLFTSLSAPARWLDTRPDPPFVSCIPASTPLADNSIFTLQAQLTCEGQVVPASAKSVLGNATVVNFQSGGGFITLFPSDATLPNASNLNFTASHIVPNSFVVGLGPEGAFKIFTSAATNFIIDLSGYFAP